MSHPLFGSAVGTNWEQRHKKGSHSGCLFSLVRVEHPEHWPEQATAGMDAENGQPLGGQPFEFSDRQFSNARHELSGTSSDWGR